MNSIIKTKLDELDAMCAEHPDSIPLKKAATYLGIDEDSLRMAIRQGKTPFGISWESEPVSRHRGAVVIPRKGFKIPTVPFYIYVTGGALFKGAI